MKLGPYTLTPAQFSGAEPIPGSLDLHSLTSIPTGFNPTVGGSLDLRSLTSIPAGFNPTVGGSLDFSSLTSPPTRRPPPVLSWQGGKFLRVDGILAEALASHGPVFRVRVVGQRADSYLVTDGAGKWAHGTTLEAARDDLVFKLSDRDKDSYRTLTPTSELSFAEAVECYRVITGACAAGVKHFVEQKGVDRTKPVRVRDILKLTEGAYGHETFAAFFTEKATP